MDIPQRESTVNSAAGADPCHIGEILRPIIVLIERRDSKALAEMFERDEQERLRRLRAAGEL